VKNLNFDVPILLIVFNRPDKTRKILDEILKTKPARLYIASDAPRVNNISDEVLCNEVKLIIDYILLNTSCKVFTLFRENNLGCKVAVSSAITWFFEHEDFGIILEDDTLPNKSFFEFCEEMLVKYYHNHSVGMICGSNLIANTFQCDESYFFSRYTPVWGWATWKRAWNLYDVTIAKWNESILNDFKIAPRQKYKKNYWNNVFRNAYYEKIDTWDYQWTFTCWENEMLAIIPSNNLIKNIGFDNTATHTVHSEPFFVKNAQPKELTFPLTHPLEINLNPRSENLIEKVVYDISFLSNVKNITKRFIKNLLWKMKFI
jgi:hypothetical protein